MDYEKAYKQALERVGELLSRCIDDRDRRTKVYRVEDIESIFPELAESKDEKVRKGLIKYFKNFDSESLYTVGLNEEEILAWLEKQSGTFTKKDVDDAYLKGISDAKNEFEKQGEHKETLCAKCRKEQPSHSCQDITALGRCYIGGINKSSRSEDEISIAIKDSKAYRIGFTDGEAYAKEEMQSSWSEEDENRLKKVMHFLSLDGRISNEELKSIFDWLKSFKERMGE